VEVRAAVAETAFVYQLELHARVLRKRTGAAPHQHGHHEEVVLVDEPRQDRLSVIAE
jgi:hypothetical protein